MKLVVDILNLLHNTSIPENKFAFDSCVLLSPEKLQEEKNVTFLLVKRLYRRI